MSEESQNQKVKSPKYGDFRAKICCYCDHWELMTEDGQTGRCPIKNKSTDYDSTCNEIKVS